MVKHYLHIHDYIKSKRSNVGNDIIRYMKIAGHCNNLNIHRKIVNFLKCSHSSSNNNDTGNSCRYLAVFAFAHITHSAYKNNNEKK